MVEKKFRIPWENGIHARPAGKLVQAIQSVNARGMLIYRQKEADMKSFLSITLLGVPMGAEVLVVTEGPEEEEALELIEKVFNTPIGETNVSTKKFSSVH